MTLGWLRQVVALALAALILAPGTSAAEERRASKTRPLGRSVTPEERRALEKLDQGLGVAYQPAPRGASVTLNFNDVALAELVRAVSAATGRRFIRSGKLRSVKASILSPGPVTAREAYQALLSVLSANGMTVVPAGRYLKIVASQDAAGLSVSVCLEGAACPADDRVITRLHRVRQTSADDMAQVLERFKTKQGDVTAFGPTNTLIITDSARNVRRLVSLVRRLDLRSLGTHIWVEPVYYGDAGEIAQILTQLFAPTGPPAATKRPRRAAKRRRRRGRKGRRAKRRAAGAEVIGQVAAGDRVETLVADERSSSLLIVATEGSYLKMMPVLRALDVAERGEEQGVHVHRLDNADAEELSSTLAAMTGRQKSGRGGRRRRRRQRRQPTKSKALERAFEGDVQIAADKATNSLIIVGSARDYASLRPIIDQLDASRRQVFVEAVIMEVSLEAQRRFGVAWHTGTDYDVELDGTEQQGLGILGTSFDSGALNSLILDPSMLQGLALGVRGPEIQGSEDSSILPAGLSIPAFGVVVQALQTSSDVNVLSTPHILAMDNEEAEIQVGQNVPVSTSFASGAGALSGLLSRATGSQSAASNIGGLFPQMSTGRQNVGIKLSVTPQINQSDQVRLELQVEVSEVSGESDLGPIIGQRTAKTTCVMRDQQTVVLGGLVTDNVVKGVQKVPVLGDIPLLGRLFKRTIKRTTKRNLLIFLTPYIVRDATDFRRIFARKMQERREFIDRYTAFEYHEVQPDIDYDRTNGMLEEIRRAVDDIDIIAEQRRALEGQEEPEHTPRRPIGVDQALSAQGEVSSRSGAPR